ncbi:MAG: hypothetical protein PHP03_00970 [Candidatus Pacebacteria bacterium]|nr:hypothetical protein [Candidatus Paceibacterota bacterium]
MICPNCMGDMILLPPLDQGQKKTWHSCKRCNVVFEFKNGKFSVSKLSYAEHMAKAEYIRQKIMNCQNHGHFNHFSNPQK